MNFKKALILYALTLLMIFPIDILGERVPKYSNIELGGTFGTNIQRKLQEKNENYIKVKYKEKAEYDEGFNCKSRYGIKYIIKGDSEVGPNDPLKIEANSEIEIHFSEPIKSLERFFNYNSDHLVENIFSIDLSHFNSSLLTNIGYMFNYCNSLEEINFTNFDTSNVNDMGKMFNGCSQLKSLDLSSFNTLNVDNMFEMFYGCSQLKSLDLSSFNTSNVFDMEKMFGNCASLEFLDISNFYILNDYMYDMLYNANNIKYIN